MKIANAPVSWGVIEFESSGKRQAFERVLDEMQATGYRGTELGDWGFLPTDPEELGRELEARDLELLGAFVPVELRNADAHAEGEAQALKVARLMADAMDHDRPFVVLSDDNGTDPVRTRNAGRVAPEMSLGEGGWETFVSGTERIAGRVAEDTGLRTVFHHHCAGFIEAPWEVQELMERTDPDLVGLCLDTGHYCYAGGDPVEAVEDYGSRIWLVHFKDCEPSLAQKAREEEWDYFEAVQQGVFCELGQGEVDFEAVVEALQAINYETWVVVEQDVFPGLGTPLESARRNRQYLSSLGL